jgi:phosphatidylserine synthase
MMVAGMIGATLFAIPQIACKVCGLVFIHLWYVLDCSDGETARITKQFSKFGTEIDYTAHVVNHPLFNLAFAYSLVGMRRYNFQLVLFASILSISAELVLRNLIAFFHIYKLKMSQEISKNGDWLFKRICIHLVNFFTVYPNFVLVFPLAYFVDYYSGTSFALYYLFIQTALSSLMAIWISYKWSRMIVNVG